MIPTSSGSGAAPDTSLWGLAGSSLVAVTADILKLCAAHFTVGGGLTGGLTVGRMGFRGRNHLPTFCTGLRRAGCTAHGRFTEVLTQCQYL